MDKIGVIGFGYVGKELALRLSTFYEVICYDIDSKKIGVTDRKYPIKLHTTNDAGDLNKCDIYIITVQTPINNDTSPDLSYLLSSTELVSHYIKKGDTVIYESTVYPGVTENICCKILEDCSGLKVNRDFYLGYSPERISPGDCEHRIDNTTKIIAGSNDIALQKLAEIYGKVTGGNIFIAKTIQEAEAAKLLENLQRDVNIALMNEFANVMSQLGIRPSNVIAAANTKWNFCNFFPGSGGGHCIGIDTYYYMKTAYECGIEPQMAKAARDINEATISSIISVISKKIKIGSSQTVCLLGAGYKNNISDIRNSASIKIAFGLLHAGYTVKLFDPLVSSHTTLPNGLVLSKYEDIKKIQALICVVYHDIFNDYTFDDTLFDNPQKAVVIDPYCKLRKLHKYNVFEL